MKIRYVDDARALEVRVSPTDGRAILVEEGNGAGAVNVVAGQSARALIVRTLQPVLPVGNVLVMANRNLANKSNNLLSSAWAKGSLNVQAVVDNTPPDAPFSLLQTDLNSGSFRSLRNFRQGPGTGNFIGANTGEILCISVYAKAQGGKLMIGGPDPVSALFDLVTGQINAIDDVSQSTGNLSLFTDRSAGMTDVGNGWWRCHYSYESTFQSIRFELPSATPIGDGVVLAAPMVHKGTTPILYVANQDAPMRVRQEDGTLISTTSNNFLHSLNGFKTQAAISGLFPTLTPSTPAWTVVTADKDAVHTVDSSGGKWINNQVNANANGFNLNTYVGEICFRALYPNVLTQAERDAVYNFAKTELAKVPKNLVYP